MQNLPSKYTRCALEITRSAIRWKFNMYKKYARSNLSSVGESAFLLITILSIFIFTSQPVQAQEATGPIYIVQPGDSLSSIAARFSVNLQELMAANGITDPNQLAVGQQLIIPGLDGITGILNTEVINFG